MIFSPSSFPNPTLFPFSHLTHFNIFVSFILREKFCPRKILPILTLNEAFVSGVQFCALFCTKTCHFFAFFSIFPLFVSKLVFSFTFFVIFFPLSALRCCSEKSYQTRKYVKEKPNFSKIFFTLFPISTYRLSPS